MFWDLYTLSAGGKKFGERRWAAENRMVLRSDQRHCSLDLCFLDAIQRGFHVHLLFCQVSDAKKSDIDRMEGKRSGWSCEFAILTELSLLRCHFSLLSMSCYVEQEHSWNIFIWMNGNGLSISWKKGIASDEFCSKLLDLVLLCLLGFLSFYAKTSFKDSIKMRLIAFQPFGLSHVLIFFHSLRLDPKTFV